MSLGSAAHTLYSQGLSSPETLNAIPRNKYTFTVDLTYDNGKSLVLKRIANVMMPSFVYRTQTLNKYNAKSIIQTGIDYTPITLTAYDTKDAVFENFLKDYAEHYFAGPMNEDDYNAFLTDPKGLQLRDNKNYITMMTITRIDAGTADNPTLKNVIEIYNPFITNADADTLDYSDSSPSVFRVSFAYEGYSIKSANSTSGDAFRNEFAVEFNEAGELVQKFDDASGQFETIDEMTKSNKSTLVTKESVDEMTKTLQTVNAQGIWASNAVERLEKANAIIAEGNIVSKDTKFIPGKNILVTKDGIVYEGQASVNVVPNDADLHPDLDGII